MAAERAGTRQQGQPREATSQSNSPLKASLRMKAGTRRKRNQNRRAPHINALLRKPYESV